MKKLLLSLALVASLYGFSPQQKQVAKLVYTEAKKYTRYPSTITAMCYTESSLNRNILGDVNEEGVNASLGAMQIQIPTVRWLSTIYDEIDIATAHLSDYELAIKLLRDIKFSVWIASVYFEHYRKAWGYRKAIMVFNGMPNGKNNWPYFHRVEKNKKIVIKLLKEIK